MPWGDAFNIKANSRTATRILISFKNKLFTNKIFFSIYFLIDYRVIKKLLKIFCEKYKCKTLKVQNHY